MSNAEIPAFRRVQLSKTERSTILTRDNFTCRYCGRKSPAVELHVDHIKPVADGGTNAPENLCACCLDCNLGKAARPLVSLKAFDAAIDDNGRVQALADCICKRFPDARMAQALEALNDAFDVEITWELMIHIAAMAPSWWRFVASIYRAVGAAEELLRISNDVGRRVAGWDATARGTIGSIRGGPPQAAIPEVAAALPATKAATDLYQSEIIEPSVPSDSPWGLILAHIGGQQRALVAEAVLKQSTTLEISKTTLHLAYSSGSFFGRHAQSPTVRESLLKAAEHVFGVRPNIVFSSFDESKPSEVLR